MKPETIEKIMSNIPENLKYSKDHEWIKVEGDTGIIGITDYAQSQLGDIVFVEVETLDQHVDKNDVIGTIEAVKTVAEIYSPVSGTVTEVNPKLDSEPELINQDPYGEGWIVKINISNPEELNDLMSAEEYKNFIETLEEE